MTKKKRRRRLKKGPKIVLILIILLIFGVIYLNIHSKKYLFLEGLDKSYDSITNIVDTFISNYIPYIDSDYYNKTNSSINVVTSEIDSNIELLGDIYLNDSSNYFDLNINTNGSDYDLEMLSKDNKLHFKIDDSKYYYTEFNSDILLDENTFKLLDVFVDNLKDNIKKSNLEKESSKVMINTESYNTKKITLHVDSSLYEKVIKSLYSDVKNDDALMNSWLSFSEYETKKELVKYLESNNISLSQELDFSIYLYKSKPIKVELSYGINQSISIIMYDDYIELGSQVEDSSSYIKFSDGKIDLVLAGIGYGSGTYDNKSFRISFTDYDKSSLGNLSYSNYKNGDKYQNDFILNLDLSDIDINIKSSNEITVDKTNLDININDSIIVDNMLEKDKETLSKLLSTINLIFAF